MKSASTIINEFASRASTAYRKAVWNRKVASGMPVRFQLPNDIDILLQPEGQIPELLFTHAFEFVELRLCSKTWRYGTSIIDIGANIGLYSITASLALGPQGHVYSFEPSSESRSRLVRNLALNQCSNVTVIDAAVSDMATSATLVREPGFRDGDRYLLPSTSAAAHTDASLGGDLENVRVCTLDDWSRTLPKLEVSFMKIDIEGEELRLFRGAQEFLRRHRDLVIMFECTPQGCEHAGCKQDDVFAVLAESGFGLHAWLERSHRWSSNERHLRESGNIWATRDPGLLAS